MIIFLTVLFIGVVVTNPDDDRCANCPALGKPAGECPHEGPKKCPDYKSKKDKKK